MTTANDVNAFLTSAGATAAKFETIGTTVKGEILAAELRNQTDMKTGEVKTFPDGNPMKQIVITLQTDVHDSDEDDGTRRIFAKGQMLSAIRTAVGRAGIQIGAKLAVRFTGEEAPKTRGFSATKLYKVWYQAPVRTVAIGGDDDPLMNGDVEPPADLNDDDSEPF